MKGLQDTPSSENTYYIVDIIAPNCYVKLKITQLQYLTFSDFISIMLIEAVHCRGPSMSEHHVGQKISRDMRMGAHVHDSCTTAHISLAN